MLFFIELDDVCKSDGNQDMGWRRRLDLFAEVEEFDWMEFEDGPMGRQFGKTFRIKMMALKSTSPFFVTDM